ncbi:hypothetical protein HMPREF9493_03141, partial [Enterococcus faecalis DAPTO 516]
FFLKKKKKKKKVFFSFPPPATAVRKKALFHKAKVKNIPVKNFFSDVRTVSRSLFRFQAVPFAVCNVLFTVCYSTIASRKNKGI